MKDKRYRFFRLSAALAFSFLLGSLSLCLPVAAASVSSAGTSSRLLSDDNLERYWMSFGEDAVVRRVDFTQYSGAIPKGCERTTDGIRVPAKNQFDATFSYDGEDGQYAVVLEYKAGESASNAVNIGIGNLKCQSIMNPIWENDGKQAKPALSNSHVLSYVTDANGIDGEPVLFSIKSGELSFTFQPEGQSTVLCSLLLINPAPSKDYNGYLHTLDGTQSGKGIIALKAEDYRVTTDSSAGGVGGASGKSSNKMSGQKTLWEFTVKTAGIYNLAFQYKRTSPTGLPVYRTIEIDGLLPFAETENIRFDKTAFGRYENLTLGNEKQTYGIYLSAGVHTIALTAVNEPVGAVYSELRNMASQMQDYGDKIQAQKSKKSTEVWKVTDDFPDIASKLDGWQKQLNDLSDKLTKIGGTEPQLTLAMNVIGNNLKRLSNDPQNSSSHLELLSGGTLSAVSLIDPVLTKLSDQSLGLGNIYIYAPGEKLPAASNPAAFFIALIILIIAVVIFFLWKARRPEKAVER